ncbi:HEPN domain-containing protein [Novosphingobium sp. 9U]|uniref:HEPN domain-containing protein n=1 Tax=Novosphingobium sp. 9U TaxID=2653158 RepID=UPI0012F0B8B5|nr:HEPN domain-containing protein [Novosphingobium sp. 9U]VWX51795.1 hypothetical protein NOVOSPHI9U_40396 [Novosphingobium sp. 9U]
MTKPTDVQNVKILFAGIIREREAFRAGQRPNKDNWFKKIDGPPGSGFFYTGDDGWEALSALNASAMKSGRILLRADHTATRRILETVLMPKFGTEGIEVNHKNVSRALSETVKLSKKQFVSRTHFIPCQLSTFSKGGGVSLGPVRFISRREAKSALKVALDRERSGEFTKDKRDRDHISRALAHYKGYQWFAQVTVADCAPSRSEEIALTAASSALDLLQALIGWRGAREMSVAGQFGHFDRTAAIARNEPTGGLSITTGWRMRGGTLPDDWPDQLARDMDHGLEQAGLILQSRVNPDLVRPVSQRLLDVAQWFGEAVRDPSPSTRVVKFITAIERLTLTEKVEDIAESVSERVAALTIGQIDNLTFYPSKKLFKKIYTVRSELAHGTISPTDPKVIAVVGKAGDYAEIALLRALFNWGAENLELTKFTPAKLRGWFEEIIVVCKSDETVGVMKVEDTPSIRE